MTDKNQRLVDERAAYQTGERVTFYRSVFEWEPGKPEFFFYLINGVGRHYSIVYSNVDPVIGGRVYISPCSADDLAPLDSPGFEKITRAEFNRLLERFVLPPVFDDETP